MKVLLDNWSSTLNFTDFLTLGSACSLLIEGFLAKTQDYQYLIFQEVNAEIFEISAEYG